jgi:hypothetical protein
VPLCCCLLLSFAAAAAAAAGMTASGSSGACCTSQTVRGRAPASMQIVDAEVYCHCGSALQCIGKNSGVHEACCSISPRAFRGRRQLWSFSRNRSATKLTAANMLECQAWQDRPVKVV